MGEDENSNDKTIFIISFLALIFALPNYKDDLEKIVLSFGEFTVSLYALFLVMGFILFLCVYTFAIYNLKYSSLKIFNTRIFHYTKQIADFLYTTAIIGFPIIVLVLYAAAKAVVFVNSLNFDVQTLSAASNIISIIAALFGLFPIVISFWITLKKNKELLKHSIEMAIDEESFSLSSAIDSYESGFYNKMLLELNNAMENSLYAKLTKMNLVDENDKPLMLYRLMKSAEQENLINEEQKSFINKLRVLRNEAAHSKHELEIEKHEAEFLLENTMKITSELGKNDKK